jgi:hypothetical protein
MLLMLMALRPCIAAALALKCAVRLLPTGVVAPDACATCDVQLSGTWKPIMGVEIDNAALAVKGGVGLLLSSAGRVFGTGFTITITASQGGRLLLHATHAVDARAGCTVEGSRGCLPAALLRVMFESDSCCVCTEPAVLTSSAVLCAVLCCAGGMDFMAHADKINLGGSLKSLVPDIPDFLFGFCKALSFAQVNVGYVNGAFTLLAVPDVLSSPELQAILKVRCSSARPAVMLCVAWPVQRPAVHCCVMRLLLVAACSCNTPARMPAPPAGHRLHPRRHPPLHRLWRHRHQPVGGQGPHPQPARTVRWPELHFSLAVSDKVPGSIMFSGSFAAGLDVFGQGELGVCLLPNRTNLTSVRECAASHTLPDNPVLGSSHLDARAAWSAGTQHSVVLCQPSVGCFACLVIASPALPACRRAAL